MGHTWPISDECYNGPSITPGTAAKINLSATSITPRAQLLVKQQIKLSYKNPILC
ncbi:hypothetical protein PVA17_22715 [Lysinibacillus sp. CNPSo 3705]|uniref:hypothetical protein n=1 Tax=Lysinibacillus sp. CNPSo 3705 TaxID=3028148 RepID=UPI0023637DED|nr:hypothetical protein [Lysinibacillus sp. CNPSo 3705]MDD1505536.1 hypothetical protein [Lysinibacillus sp. CNPSo 3705]